MSLLMQPTNGHKVAVAIATDSPEQVALVGTLDMCSHTCEGQCRGGQSQTQRDTAALQSHCRGPGLEQGPRGTPALGGPWPGLPPPGPGGRGHVGGVCIRKVSFHLRRDITDTHLHEIHINNILDVTAQHTQITVQPRATICKHANGNGAS